MASKRTARVTAMIVLTVLLATVNCMAQAVYGSIFGTVTDTSGAAVVGAKVTVTNVGKGISETTTTNASGNYQVLHLIPDAYNVKFEMKGFKSVENKGVAVSADTAARIDIKLAVGGATEQVEVVGEAPLLKTDRADVAQLLDENVTMDLPLSGRNFTSLELLTPGATYQAGWQHATTENPQQSQQIFINGQMFGGTSYSLDGTDNKDPVLGLIVINPTLESVAEVKVTTQNYDAEFGNGTAGVVTAQTKSGSNNLHGSLFEYFQSDATQAKNPFAGEDPVTHRVVPQSKYNQFGGSLGGPVIKSRLFFFGDYQGTRRTYGTSIRTSVPTAKVRNTCLNSSSNICDLSDYNFAIYDPATGTVDGTGRTAFAGNIIPKARVNAAAIKLLSLLPAPTTTGTSNNYNVSGSAPFNDNTFNVRTDAQISNKLNVFGRYTYFRSTQESAGVFGTLGGPGFLAGNATGNDLARNDSVATGFDYAISPKLLTDFRFGYFRYHIMNSKYNTSMNAASDLGLPGLNISSDATTGGLPTFTFSDSNLAFGSVNCNCPLNEDEKQIQFVNNWTMISGNHTVKFGADLRLAMNLRDASDLNRTGQFSINSLGTQSPDSATPSGLGLATFLLGGVSQFQRFVIRDNHYASEHQKRFFGYAQDTWRVTPKLTLNLGVRWDDIFPETVTATGRGGATNLVTGTIDVAGVGGIPTNGGLANNPFNFAPRIGAAYQLTPKTVIRGGFGRAYDEGIFGLMFGSALTHNQPVMATQNLVNPDQHTSILALGAAPAAYVFPSIPGNGRIVMQDGQSYYAARPRTIKPVTVDSYNLTVQQQLSPNTTLSVGYVGNHGVHVAEGYWGYNVNQPSVGPGSVTSRMPLYNKYNNGGITCCSMEVDYLGPDSNSNYNSLQVVLNRKMNHGLQWNAFYVWSRALDHSSEYFQVDKRFGYGRSDYNRDHVFTSALIYDLPFGKGRKFANGISRGLDYVIGGWQLSNITSIATGLPFTWSYSNSGNDSFGAGISMRPSLLGSFPVGAGKFDPTTQTVQYFVPVATLSTYGSQMGPWMRPAQYTSGNQGRNTATGPGMYTSDLSLSKNFAITERMKAEFKMDVYNLFNHAVLGLPNRCVDCSVANGAGQITSLQGGLSMRQLQFGARFTF